MDSKDSLSIRINGEQRQWDGDPTLPLADFIREEQELTGTKIGCRTGECGACTVLMDGKPVVSCITPVALAVGKEIETVEQLSEKEEFQQLAQAMVETGGVQCGFCTPGMMTSLYAYLQDPSLFDGDVTVAIKNNLCRCTGYKSIENAVAKVIDQGGKKA